MQRRDQDTTDWRTTEWRYKPITRNDLLVGGIAGVIVGFCIGLLLFDVTDYSTNAYTEFLSIAVTVLVLDRLNAIRGERQQKQELIVQMSSQSNDFALMAVRLLREKKWLYDGSLQKAFLFRANLQGARLEAANLQGASLRFANLQGAVLRGANLQGASLWRANLQGANLHLANLQTAELYNANLQGANLWFADLQGADLVRVNLQGAKLVQANLQGARLEAAKLQGAILWNADLQGANLLEATFDEETLLPDGINWHPDVDMKRFTDPEHPDFWESPVKLLWADQM